MKKLLDVLLKRFGYVAYSKKAIKYYKAEELEKMYSLDEFDSAYLRGKSDGGLKQKLIDEKKTRWLEIGCGGTLDDNFFYVDLFPEGIVAKKEKYFRLNIINATDTEIAKLGKFDLIRMQHVFEHFTPEDGLKVLDTCSKLLNKDGYILISTPDLKRMVQFYLTGIIREDSDWAKQRIPAESPNSFYFSVFTHSLQHEKHEWCYDYEGLKFQLERSDKFKNIKEIKLNDDLAIIPFTHNRPNNDVCVLAQLK